MSKEMEAPRVFWNTPEAELLRIARDRTMDVLYNDLYDELIDYQEPNSDNEPDYERARIAVKIYNTRMEGLKRIEKELEEGFRKNEMHA